MYSCYFTQAVDKKEDQKLLQKLEAPKEIFKRSHVYSAVCKFSPLCHLDGLKENCRKHRPSFEWVNKPSSETSNGAILFPYFLNKTLTNFLIQQSEHLV